MTEPAARQTTRQPFICTPDTPWSVGLRTPVRHQSAREVGDQRDGYPSGDLVTMRCDVCGHEWERELPQ